MRMSVPQSWAEASAVVAQTKQQALRAMDNRKSTPEKLRKIVIDRPQLLQDALEEAEEQEEASQHHLVQDRYNTRRLNSASTGKRSSQVERLRQERKKRTRSGSSNENNSIQEPKFASNVVTSAKYSVWNFIPKVLLAQSKQPSNIYFLCIAMLQTIKEVSNTRGVPTILLPLLVVFICSAIKEALEDRERHRADHITNTKTTLTLNAMGEWKSKPWGEIRVGDIVKVMHDEVVPADLFMLSAEELEDEDKQILDLSIEKSECKNQAQTLPEQAKDEEKVEDDELIHSHVRSQQPSHRFGSSGGNLAYIETKSLDGETNLKIRTAIPLLSSLCSHPDNGINKLRGVMECEPPNNRITSFEGKFSVYMDPDQARRLIVTSDGADGVRYADHHQYPTMIRADNSVSVTIPVTAKQMILRSCMLKNTRSVTGLVVFTGHETKVFCSNTEPVIKTSSVEQRLNSLIIRVVIIQQLVCLVAALLGSFWMVINADSYWYLHGQSHHREPAVHASFSFGELLKLHVRYFIIMQNFVPISLNVSLEFVKYWQAYFIQQDLEMYDEVSDTPTIVRSSALNEDLGRVHHIFTDKTGTLTMNLMLFRYCMVDGKHYGGEIREGDMEAGDDKRTASDSSSPFVDFDPSELFSDLQTGGVQADRIQLFLRHLALCHTLIPSKPFAEMCTSSTPEYSASSPDEQALVSAAAYCNVRFVHRTPSTMSIMEPGESVPSTYKILNLLEFDSDRKRMSVILENPDGEVELFCKGADNVIFERLSCDQTQRHGIVEQAYSQLSRYAKCGMRTLCLAHKKIARTEYAAWNDRYMKAYASMDELVKKRQGLPNEIDPLMNEIEQDLILVGVTAVQDKLQMGVPKTLRVLQNTNVKVWTLTGDKMETAINIGYACSLLSDGMEVKQLSFDDYVSTAKALQEIMMHYENQKMGSCLSQRYRRRHHTSSKKQNWLKTMASRIRSLMDRTPPIRKKKRIRSRNELSRSFSNRGHAYSPVTSLGWDDSDDAEDNCIDEIDNETMQLAHLLMGRTTLSHSRASFAMVIDGKTLEFALKPRLSTLFYNVTSLCSTVICCRVSPKQKADIVEFIRDFEPESITLAIGDGANDVAMIQTAHIGVGISGQEGTQAVNSADYAIAQFRFLQRLLQVHGRWAYRRVAKLMSYMLYKNVTYVLTTFWFGCFCGFSGQPLIIDIAAQTFNVLYTSLPLVVFAVFDQDISSESAAKFPSLYALGQKNVLLTRKVFWPWIFNGLLHSLVIFFVSAWGFDGTLSIDGNPTMHPSIIAENGQDSGLNTLGFVVFTNLVVVVNLKLCLETFMMTWFFLATVGASILLWFIVGALISLPSSHMHQAVGEMMYLARSPSFWSLCVLVITLSLLRDLLWKMVRRLQYPSTYHILQEREMLSLPNSPRRMLSEYKGQAWSDIQQPMVDYAKFFRQIPQFENAQDQFMRSSPLAESLISTASSGSTGSHETRQIRARGSFHVIGSTGHSAWDDKFEPQGFHGTVSMPNAELGTQQHQYHGYAFSEDENVDSDVEAAYAASPRAKGKPKTHQSSLVAGGLAYNPRAGASPGSSLSGGRSLKKMIKSVRGQKKA